MLAAEDTETSSPSFTNDFEVSQLDEFLGEVSGLAQIKKIDPFGCAKAAIRIFLNAVSFFG